MVVCSRSERTTLYFPLQLRHQIRQQFRIVRLDVMIDSIFRHFQFLQDDNEVLPDGCPFLALGQIEIGHEFREPLQGDFVLVFVVSLDDPLLVPGKVLHGHNGRPESEYSSIMRVILQRAAGARVKISGETVGEIQRGWLALVGVAVGDTRADAEWLADKVANLRAFEDDAGKMNRSVQDVNGGVLVVSNFTLYADCQKGRRPSFIDAARPDAAEPLVVAFANGLRALGIPVAEGRFGAEMQVELTNDGPVTLILDSPTKSSN